MASIRHSKLFIGFPRIITRHFYSTGYRDGEIIPEPGQARRPLCSNLQRVSMECCSTARKRMDRGPAVERFVFVLRSKEFDMAKILCVLYDDPIDGYPKSYPPAGLPKIHHYP